MKKLVDNLGKNQWFRSIFFTILAHSLHARWRKFMSL